jgi:hypothetical protein
VGDDRGAERLSGAGASPVLVEQLGGLGVGVFLEQLVDQRDGVGVNFACLPAP